MHKNICLAQTAEELKFILNNIKVPLTVVPLDLDVQLYCILKKINFINPNNLIKENFYVKALNESEKLTNNLDFGNINVESIKKEYAAIIRFYFNASVYLIEIFKFINSKHNIESIFVSGWNNYQSVFYPRNHFISHMAQVLLDKNKIKVISMKKNLKREDVNSDYKIYPEEIKNKKLIVLSNAGYNFKRIIFWSLKNKYNIVLPFFNKRKINDWILKILGIKFLNFSKKKISEENKIKLPDISYFYDKKDLSEILNYRKNQVIGYLTELNCKYQAINDFFEKNKPSLIISNILRGLPGFYVESGNKNNIPTLAISHGTVSKAFNEKDIIYKKIIAQAVFSEKSKYTALQSKIAKEALKTIPVEGKALETGNIIFAEKLSRNIKRKKNILVAVTLKNFFCLQYYGVEMYFEFLKNLDGFNLLAKNKKLNFLIQLHPSAYSSIDLLKKVYKNLDFTTKKIEKNLTESFATISYSSTSIEDSLNCKVPVILFDPSNRYKHCDSISDPKIKNKAIYYVNSEEDLVIALNTIKESENINFEQYLYNGTYTKNIEKLLSSIL